MQSHKKLRAEPAAQETSYVKHVGLLSYAFSFLNLKTVTGIARTSQAFQQAHKKLLLQKNYMDNPYNYPEFDWQDDDASMHINIVLRGIAIITAFSVVPNGMFVCGHADGSMQAFDAYTVAPVAKFQAHNQRITAFALTEDGSLVSASLDGKLKMWRVDKTARQINLCTEAEVQYEAKTGCCHLLTMLAGDRLVGAISSGPQTYIKQFEIWKVDTKETKITLERHIPCGEHIPIALTALTANEFVSASIKDVVVWNHLSGSTRQKILNLSAKEQITSVASNLDYIITSTNCGVVTFFCADDFDQLVNHTDRKIDKYPCPNSLRPTRNLRMDLPTNRFDLSILSLPSPTNGLIVGRRETISIIESDAFEVSYFDEDGKIGIENFGDFSSAEYSGGMHYSRCGQQLFSISSSRMGDNNVSVCDIHRITFCDQASTFPMPWQEREKAREAKEVADQKALLAASASSNSATSTAMVLSRLPTSASANQHSASQHAESNSLSSHSSNNTGLGSHRSSFARSFSAGLSAQSSAEADRKTEAAKINAQMSAMLNKCFAENEPTWRQTMQKQGFSEQDIDEIIQKTKLDSQVSLINDFKKSVKEKEKAFAFKK